MMLATAQSETRKKPAEPVVLGQATSPGPKDRNDDFHGALIPEGQMLASKGRIFAVADGISTSSFGGSAAQTAIRSLMSDYFATPEAWTAKTAISRVVNATNSWLNAQSSFKGIYDPDRGYVCTLATLVLKGATAHIFNIGDSRIWRVTGDTLEPLTRVHRVTLSDGQTVLSRALGVESAIEIDYRKETVARGDVYILSTDGLHEVWNEKQVVAAIKSASKEQDLDAVAAAIIEDALDNGADDNLTIQIIRIDQRLDQSRYSFSTDEDLQPLTVRLTPGSMLDGITILREIHSNHRSEIFIGHLEDGRKVCVKIPAQTVLQDEEALRRFMIEEWVARRINSPHTVSVPTHDSSRSGLYLLTDLVEGQTLRQWMHDNPERSVEQVRTILEQIIKGLRAIHRKEMLHQDLRPENIILSEDLHVTIIDFGSAYVAGVQEAGPAGTDAEIMGTVQYTAPEYYAAQAINWRSDLFSLGVIAYELFTDALPYGTQVSHMRKASDLRKLRYQKAQSARRIIPDWIDDALARAVHPIPEKRFDALSEFAGALRAPSIHYRAKAQKPLFDRTPLEVWRIAAIILAGICLGQGLLLAEKFQ
ncbi:bifunctional protein-serine/threonine kinase/phosphatase [uncultured Cohaesibacter sp.]|uniref:bifunctional protein-serine/threonine kinase/phosphatase n=1 Tax=uncultured Cohaesibacter sp. TaxID=1002546 RepID=UPI0029C6133C|nr:bifunctional protein-serine/threonine kinase/phosphatase [uncultured Cohaesibacter sp.]